MPISNASKLNSTSDDTAMRTILLTGADGFVGPYVVKALHEMCAPADIIVTTKGGGHHPAFGKTRKLDVTDMENVDAVIAQASPTHVVHLAGIAAVATASHDPDAAWAVNVGGARHVARAILTHTPDCWMLNVGSGLIYGETAKRDRSLAEDALPAPVDEYGATKTAADFALGTLARQGLKVIRLRPFNHTGAGQTEAFAIPAFAAQIARIEAGAIAPRLRVGNLEAERDYLDVRDVARAYALCVNHADHLPPGLVLNVASGVPRKMRDLLDILLSRSRCDIAVEQDPSRMRASDIPRIAGDASRIRNLLGWQPEFTIEETLDDVLNDCRAQVARH